MSRIFDKKQLAHLITNVIAHDAKNTTGIQTALIQGTQHAVFAGNGDITELERLVKGTKGADRKAMMLWLREYSCITLHDGKPATCNKVARKSMLAGYETAESLVEYLESLPSFADFVPDKDEVVRTLNCVASAESLIRRIRENVATGKQVNDAGLADYLEKAVAEYQAAQA